MNSTLKISFFSAALAILALPAVAQTTPTPTPAQTAPAAPTAQSIQGRKENQQDRIANGIQEGQLTAG